MKKILIIYPHFPPSNLAGVHRARLFAQHLPSFGWEPAMLIVDEKYYEEKPDFNLVKLLPKNLRIEKVSAYKRKGPIGDIGLRAFLQLYNKAKALLKKEKFDFLYIPIPSFYCALLGRRLHATTGIRYGIDYIDPWVHTFPGSDKKFSRHWFSTKFAKMLEPIAVKNASLITGVAEGYYAPVLERNPQLKKVISGAMPYGGEEKDHSIIPSLNIKPYLFGANESGKLRIVYAGAMLPKAYEPLENIFEAISANKAVLANTEFHFIGTGSSPDNTQGYNIKPLAEKYGLWQTIVFEYPARIPYLDVLVHLQAASGVFILGSTEPHYTPSKVYQAILSEKPILAVLHSASSAASVIRASHAGVVLDFDGEDDVKKVAKAFPQTFENYLGFLKNFSPLNVDLREFSKFSAREVTGKLASLLDQATAR